MLACSCAASPLLQRVAGLHAIGIYLGMGRRSLGTQTQLGMTDGQSPAFADKAYPKICLNTFIAHGHVDGRKVKC